VCATIESADLVLHAGDVVSQAALDELQAMRPTIAVLGNNDGELSGELPLEWRGELGGVRIAMVHDAGARAGRCARLHRRFPDADLVVYGHSHVPDTSVGVAGQLLFNPGSPTQRRRQPVATVGTLELADGHVLARRVIPVQLRT